jgi:hypothetical protein
MAPEKKDDSFLSFPPEKEEAFLYIATFTRLRHWLVQAIFSCQELDPVVGVAHRSAWRSKLPNSEHPGNKDWSTCFLPY